MIKVLVELDPFKTDGCCHTEEDYIKYYKPQGWLYDKDYEAIYYEVELPFMPIEGQRLGIIDGIAIVTYAIYEIGEEKVLDKNSFYNRTRIVVDYE
jgi:hypothetical protein